MIYGLILKIIRYLDRFVSEDTTPNTIWNYFWRDLKKNHIFQDLVILDMK